MATVELSFAALPAHVRTARLVAAAVARRSGVDEAVLDEVRLAVGEACSRAVELHIAHCPDELVQVALSDDGPAFRVAVSDCAPQAASVDESSIEKLVVGESVGGPDGAADDLDDGVLPANVGLAVISGLVDDVSVEENERGVTVRMSWPTPAA
jgi:serine/threonine-protein kinase RsbW